MSDKDYIQIEDGDRGDILFRGNTNIWPPPDRLWFTYVMSSPDVHHIDTDETLEVTAQFYGDTGVEVCVSLLVRTSMSKLTDEEIASTDFMARGALYLPSDSRKL